MYYNKMSKKQLIETIEAGLSIQKTLRHDLKEMETSKNYFKLEADKYKNLYEDAVEGNKILETKLKEVREERNKFYNNSVSLGNEITKLYNEIETLKEDNEKKDLSIKAFIEDKDRLNKENQMLRDAGQELKDEINKLKDENRSYDERNKDLLEDRDNYLSEVQKLGFRVKQYKNTEKAMEKDIEELHTTIKKLCEVLA